MTGGSQRPPAAKGFTLIELMVAISVFAVISAAMLVALNEILRGAAASRAELDRLAALQRGFVTLGNDFRQAVPRPTRDQLGDSMPALTRRGERLHLTRSGHRSLAGSSGSNLQHVAYELADDGRLLRHSWPVLDRGNRSEPRTRVLLRDVEGMTLRYRHRGGWRDQWPPLNQSEASVDRPRAIAIRLELSHYGAVTRTFALP
jgi:general secretion pathway protein J